MEDSAHINYSALLLDELAEVILERVHPVLNRAAASLEAEINVAKKIDPPFHREVNLISKVFADLKNKLEQHYAKEAHLLFPVIKKLGEEQRKGNYSSTGDMILTEEKMILLFAEHRPLKQLLAQIRMLCMTYPLSVNSSPSLKKFYAEFSHFEQELLKLFFIENEILTSKFKRYSQFIIDLNLKGVVS